MRLRLLVALVATSVLTLAVAALTLLSPLQSRLRAEAVDSLRTALVAERPQFDAALRARTPEARERRLFARAFVLRGRTDARVLVFTELPRLLVDTDFGPESTQAYRATLRALIDEATTSRREADLVTIATPIFGPEGRVRGTAVVERRLTAVTATVQSTRRAFLTAAGVGLAVALAVGLALSATLSRRLARLRDAAVRVTTEGPEAEVPVDVRRDEVGDLTRAFARMQTSLRRQEEARRAFVATASHELRTPLTMLQGTLELLEEDLHDGRLDHEDAREQVAGAQRELRRLARLAAELLDLSRLDADVPLRREPVELGELARAVAAEFRIAAGERRLALEVQRPPGPCWAGGDPGAVARVLRILLENALRHAPDGSTIRVVPGYHGERATVAVADKGPGVPESDRERIFRRFERGSTTPRESGFGLGLAIGRELATRMGGALRLEDGAAPGATFVLELPIELPSGSHAGEALHA